MVATLLKTESSKPDDSTSTNAGIPASDLLTKMFRNEQNKIDFDYANSCGRNNCPSTQIPTSLSKPTRSSFIQLYISLIVLCVLSMIVTLLFMDNIKEEEDHEDEVESNYNELKSKNSTDLKEIRVKEKISFTLIGKLLNYK